MTEITICIDKDLKEKAEDVLKSMGMDLPTAITMFLTKVAAEKRIPFEFSYTDLFTGILHDNLDENAIREERLKRYCDDEK